MSETRNEPHSLSLKPPRALLLAIQPPERSDAEVSSSLQEMERLAGTLGIATRGTEVQKRTGASATTFVGSGKLKEVAALIGATTRGNEPDAAGPSDAADPPSPAVDLVLVDAELSPRQQRALELALGVEVLDRTAVILEIFEKRARTREAMLEVEIARLRYDLPRRRDNASRDDRRGGGGRGARGDTNLELSKERIRDRISRLTSELAAVQARGAVQRARGQDAFQAVLVGYTNAGKSSLMRGLTGSQVPVEDKLFATLGTTVRQIRPATTPPILVSDTVGFIKNLPHELVASFRSTLDAALDADHILWVVDASDPDWRDQLEVTRDTLESLGAGRIPRTLVLNKIDRASADARERLAAEFPEAVQVSALDARDLVHLHGILVGAQGRGLHETSLMVPFSRGRMLGEIHQKAHVMEERHTEDGTVLRLRAGMANLERWRGMLGGGEPAERIRRGGA